MLQREKNRGNIPASSTEILQTIFNPQGNLVLSASADGTLRILDPTVPTVVLRSFGGRKIRTTNLAFSPDGHTLAVTYADSTLQLWNVQTGDLLLTTRDADGPILAAVFHPNGRWLLTGGKDIRIRSVTDAVILKSIPLPAPAQNILILPGGSNIAAIAIDGSVNTFRLLDKKPDVTPPSIVILKPLPSGTEAYQIYAEEVDVAGQVSDNATISSLVVDNIPMAAASLADVPHKPSDTTAVVKSFAVMVKLRAQGSNIITLTAKDSAGNSSTQALRIINCQRMLPLNF